MGAAPENQTDEEKPITRTTYRQERLGATAFGQAACRFLVWAPRATDVQVHITEPQERLVNMEADGCGYFSALCEDAPAGTLYRYRLNGEKERPDPASRYQPQGVHGPSQVVDNQFNWNDDSWRGLPLEHYILYEVHVGTFTAEGTFDAVIPRIAALKDLGVTAIELMPVSQFPGNRNWGYDGVYPYAVQESYGGLLALKRLVDACHRAEMGVVLDVVYNHMGPEGNYLPDFGPYFTDSYKTPWGDALNFDGAHSDEVRRYFIENALEWVTDFHLDALRLDAVHAIVDPSARPFLQELGDAVHKRAKELGRNIYLFPESDRNDAKVVRPVELGGWGLDAVWNDDFHHSVHVLMTGEQDGYYADFHGIEDLARAFRDGFVYMGQYSEFRERRHGNSSADVPARHFVVYAQNHDQVGNRRVGERLSQLVSFDRLKLAAGIVLLSPYIPLLFMGEEYGESAPFQYFVSHEDPALIEAVRRGRKEEFARFGWSEEIPDPQGVETFNRCKLNWASRHEGHHGVLRRFYEKLLTLRKTIPALARLDKNAMEVTSFPEQKLLFVLRGEAPARVMAAFHFDARPAGSILPVPAGRWKTILDSAGQQWAGEGSEVPDLIESPGKVRLLLAPWSLSVFAELGQDE